MKIITAALTAFLLSCSSLCFADTTYPLPTLKGTTINGLGIGQNDRPGQRLAVLGDVTGDQFPDFIFSGGYGGSDKHLYLMKGSLAGLPTSLNTSDMWIPGKIPNVTIITETDPYTQCGRFLAGGGDFDGDKINDFAFTCFNTNANKRTYYLVYGAANYPAIIKTTDIGFLVRGERFTFAGPTDSSSDEYIAFGDITGDGKSELALGYGIQRQLYVLKGGTTFVAGQVVTLSESYFTGTNGFTAKMAAINSYYFPYAVTLADMNSDGRKDIVFGQVNYVNGNSTDRALLIALGKPTFPALLNVTDANANGIDIARINAGNIDILDLVEIDDVNIDGIKDLAIANKSDYSLPKINIMFGRLAFTPGGDTVNFDGKDGSVIDGLGFTYLLSLRPDSGREAFASRAGDFNNDGIKDIILGSQYSKRWGTTGLHRSVIVMGQRIWPAKITLNSSYVNGVKAVEFTGPKSAGFSVGYIENIYGGVGCGLDSSYIMAAPYSQGTTGNIFISNFKK